jgi:hypothetical protein
MNFASGKSVTCFTIFSDSRWAASSVESGAASRNIAMCPWSSTGASSRRDHACSGQIPAMTSTAAATIAQRIARAPSSSLA